MFLSLPLAPVKNGLKTETDSSEDEVASEVVSSGSGKTSGDNAGAYAVPQSSVRRTETEAQRVTLRIAC